MTDGSWLWGDEPAEPCVYYRIPVSVSPGEHLMTWITADEDMEVWLDGVQILP